MMPARRSIPALVLSLAALGCASAPPVRHVVPPQSVPGHWLSGPAVALEQPQHSPSEATAWWSDLADEQSAVLVEACLRDNHDLHAVAARVRAASAQARMVGAPQWPHVLAGGDAMRSRRNFIGFPVAGAAGAAGGGVATATTSVYGASLSASWEADLWGRLRDGQRAALADVAAAEADLAGFRLSLSAQVLRTYFAAVEARRQLELAESTVATSRLSERQIEVRYERGLRPALDLRLARSNRAASEAVQAQRHLALDGIQRQLELLVGRYPAASLELAQDLPSVPRPVPPGLPAQLVARRPDLAAAERRLAATGARVGEARKSLYPRLSLTASGGRSSDALDRLLDGDYSVWTLVANLSAPLFQGGRLRAGVDLAEAAREVALAQYAGQALIAYGEVERALMAENLLADQEAALAETAREAAAALVLAQTRYNTGLTDLITVLDAQRREFLANSQLLSARRQRLEARINLHVALGGDFAGAAGESAAGPVGSEK